MTGRIRLVAQAAPGGGGWVTVVGRVRGAAAETRVAAFAGRHAVATLETQAPATLAAVVGGRSFVDTPLPRAATHPRVIHRSSTLDPERGSPCVDQYSAATMTNDQGLFTKIKESSLSISLTAALILVASIVVIISSITIQSAYMWLAVGATAVLFLGFCSCTTCEKTSHFHFRRGSMHSDSVSTISDGRDNFYEVGHHLQNSPPYWIADLPPSYAAATAAPAADCQLPPPYSAVADVHAPLQRVYTDAAKQPPPTVAAPPYGSAIAQLPSTPPPPFAVAVPRTLPSASEGHITSPMADNSSPLHVPSRVIRGDPSTVARPTATVGTDTRHPPSCSCDACNTMSC